MLTSSFSPWPCYTREESDAIERVLLSNKVNYWTGEECREFEVEFASFAECDYAVAVTNGTVALDLCFEALGIGKGDEVIVTPRTFLASISSIVNAGAVPIFADVDLDSQNITADTIRSVLTPRSRAILCVHLAGWPCDMDPIMALAEEYGLYVVEDCAQAHGAKYKGRSVGSIGHVAAWSFCQDKIITTGGEGGMVTTNAKDLWSKVWSYKDHGKSWDAVYNRNHPPGFRWLHDSFGTNWRMTEIQAAIGRIQLKRMNHWSAKRWANASQIWAIASQCDRVRVPSNRCAGCSDTCLSVGGCSHAAYKCYIFIEGTQKDRDSIMEEINLQGVPCYAGSCSEVYLERAFDGTGFRPPNTLANAKLLGQTSLMFLCHPTLTPDEMQRTCEVIKKAITVHWELAG
jgi:dTDP-4-amino-4,6-dideoxygalactose transaminase